MHRFCFRWIIPFVKKAKQSEIEINDLYKVLESDESNTLSERLGKYWQTELNDARLNSRTPNIYKVIFKTFGWYYFKWGIASFLYLLSR